MSLMDIPAVTHVEEGGHRTNTPEILITETVFLTFLPAQAKFLGIVDQHILNSKT